MITPAAPRRLAAQLCGHAVVLLCKGVTAVRADWRGIAPVPRQRVYFANHTSNADLPMIWSVLPPALRRQTRPVAAADYWLRSPLRAFFGAEVFRAVLIDCRPDARREDPMSAILAGLDEGSSLIIFPEGNRNMTDAPLLPFKAGLYNIGRARPDVDLAGLDRQPQRRHAQGRGDPLAAHRHRHLRRPPPRPRGRGKGRLPRPRHGRARRAQGRAVTGQASGTAGGVALLALAVLGVLVALTAAGEALRARVPPGRSVPGVETFNARVRSWWTMAVLLGLALLLGRAGAVVLFAVAAFAALREFATYTAKSREDHGMLATAFFVVLPLQFLWVALGAQGLFTVFVPVHVFLLLPLIAVLMGAPQRFLTRVAETQWALMVCVYCASHVPALLTLGLRGPGGEAAGGLVLLIPFLVIAVQGGEIAATAAERRRRGRAIAPDLSPRTWEAAGTGVLAAAGLGLLLAWLTPFGPGGAALMAGAAAAAGLGGTLVLAAIKRERGVRDWSHMIPGQGGVLDQAGGVLFAAPLFYHLAAWGWGA